MDGLIFQKESLPVRASRGLPGSNYLVLAVFSGGEAEILSADSPPLSANSYIGMCFYTRIPG